MPEQSNVVCFAVCCTAINGRKCTAKCNSVKSSNSTVQSPPDSSNNCRHAFSELVGHAKGRSLKCEKGREEEEESEKGRESEWEKEIVKLNTGKCARYLLLSNVW